MRDVQSPLENSVMPTPPCGVHSRFFVQNKQEEHADGFTARGWVGLDLAAARRPDEGDVADGEVPDVLPGGPE